jgi:hypothetical protein
MWGSGSGLFCGILIRNIKAHQNQVLELDLASLKGVISITELILYSIFKTSGTTTIQLTIEKNCNFLASLVKKNNFLDQF